MSDYKITVGFDRELKITLNFLPYKSDQNGYQIIYDKFFTKKPNFDERGKRLEDKTFQDFNAFSFRSAYERDLVFDKINDLFTRYRNGSMSKEFPLGKNFEIITYFG